MSCRSFIVAFLLSLASLAASADDKSDYQLHDLEGRLHKASDQHGKWLVINFWATWSSLPGHTPSLYLLRGTEFNDEVCVPNGTKLSPTPQSLRYPKGIKERQRRGNLQTPDIKVKDCFAALAMTALLLP